MMILAAWYTQQDDHPYSSWERDQIDITVDLNFLGIFLVLHLEDTVKIGSPAAAYDTFWPAAYMDETGTVASPKSGGHSSHGIHVKIPTTLPLSGSPKSPRSPKSSSPRPTSPKRTHLTSPRQSRTSAQHLHSLRQKLPLILKIICLDDSAIPHDDSFVEPGSDDGFQLSGALEFMVSRKALDSLSLIIAGGTTKDKEVKLMLLLLPQKLLLLLFPKMLLPLMT